MMMHDHDEFAGVPPNDDLDDERREIEYAWGPLLVGAPNPDGDEERDAEEELRELWYLKSQFFEAAFFERFRDNYWSDV